MRGTVRAASQSSLEQEEEGKEEEEGENTSEAILLGEEEVWTM